MVFDANKVKVQVDFRTVFGDEHLCKRFRRVHPFHKIQTMAQPNVFCSVVEKMWATNEAHVCKTVFCSISCYAEKVFFGFLSVARLQEISETCTRCGDTVENRPAKLTIESRTINKNDAPKNIMGASKAKTHPKENKIKHSIRGVDGKKRIESNREYNRNVCGGLWNIVAAKPFTANNGSNKFQERIGLEHLQNLVNPT